MCHNNVTEATAWSILPLALFLIVIIYVQYRPIMSTRIGYHFNNPPMQCDPKAAKQLILGWKLTCNGLLHTLQPWTFQHFQRQKIVQNNFPFSAFCQQVFRPGCTDLASFTLCTLWLFSTVTFQNCYLSKLQRRLTWSLKDVLFRFGCSCQGTRSSTILLRFSTSARQVGFSAKGWIDHTHSFFSANQCRPF